MDLNNVVIRPAELDDIDAIADIYSALWCGWLRREEHAQDERLVARFNTVMQAQCSPIALVAELDGKIIAACYVGVYDKGTPRTNPYWQQTYDELFERATARAQTADGQLNLIIVLPEYQGCGLGRRLIEVAREHMRELGCKRFFLMTDNRSDWEFYEHLGMERVAEDHSQDTGDNFIVYIYGGLA